jgi:hypothetical protein
VELRDLRLLKAGEARVGTPFGRRTAGAYALDVHVHEVRARLEPGPPEARFAGKRIDVALPVRLTRGEGRATLRLRWDSKGMAGAVCGDFQARIAVEGTLVPRTYPVKGSFGLDLEGGRLTAVPSFPDLELRLEVEPRPATWRAFGRVLRQRSWRCRAALGMVDVPGQVRRLLHKGLRVKIPPRVFKPLPLPAAASPQVTLEGRTYRLDVTPRAISIGPRVVWYSAAVRARRTDEPPASPQPSPPPALEAPESGSTPSSPGPTSDSPSPQPTSTPSPEPLPTPSPEPTPTPSPTPPPPLD